MNKYANSMAVGVMDLANKVVDKKKILTETDGRVVGTSGDKYIVEIKGEQYTIPSINGATFELNKTVKVIQPNGATDVTGQYIIGGKVDVGSIVSGVTSVNGHTGSIITLDKTDIGLGNVDNVKQATKTEFDAHTGNTGIHVTSTDKTLWNTVTDKADKTSVLTDVPENALFTDTVTTINGKTGTILKDDIVALGIPEQDTVYVHPANHPALMIVQDETHRFVTDTEITTWTNSNHTHNNLSLLQTITQTLVDGWNSAVTHITDTIKHITSSERALWNTVNDKVDKIVGKGLSTEDYTTVDKTKLSGIEDNANNYTHPSTHSVDMITGLATIATSGDYDDLSGTPTSLPANGGNADTVDGKHASDFATIEYVDEAVSGSGSSDGALIFDKIANQIGVKVIESTSGENYITQVKQASTNLLLTDKTESKVSDSYVTVIRVYDADGITVTQTFTITESKNGDNYETIVT